MKLNTLERELEKIYQDLVNHEFIANQIAEKVHDNYKMSAMNLFRYLLLRKHDLRNLHDHLSEIGISSLRSSESYVYKNVADTLQLTKLVNKKQWSPEPNVASIGYKKSRKTINKHRYDLFGKKTGVRDTKIMVTLPSEAASDIEFVHELIINGMELARINMSQNTQETWLNMIKTVNQASKDLKSKCYIYMDLSGPKIRTGEIQRKKKGKKQINYISIKKGDHIIVHDTSIIGHSAKYGRQNELIKAAEISITNDQIIKDLAIGERILFDDGKIETKIIGKSKNNVKAIVINDSDKKLKLRSGKGVNFPDSVLTLPSLTENDIANIPFALEYADIIGYSFVRHVHDVENLIEVLQGQKKKKLPGIVLKIENKEAFEQLPMLLMKAMELPKIGVMIARGDLAIELGAERISEVQDQIMWICEAAHVPVIWATQVLENLAKTGIATRAEVSDASIGAKAECVMLNKGPYIHKAVSTLSDVLIRMEKHLSKKKSRMRSLEIAAYNMREIPRQILKV